MYCTVFLFEPGKVLARKQNHSDDNTGGSIFGCIKKFSFKDLAFCNILSVGNRKAVSMLTHFKLILLV